MNAERIRSAFEHFVNVGVVEGIAGRTLVLKLLATERGGRLEVRARPEGGTVLELEVPAA